MKKFKYIFYGVVIAFAIFNFNGLVLAQSEEAVEETKFEKQMILSIITATDKRIDSRRKENDPTIEELMDRFSIELDDHAVNKKKSRKEILEEMFKEGGDIVQQRNISRIIGVADEDTTFKVMYTYPDGNKVEVVGGMRALQDGKYPEFDFAPPIQRGDNNGPKDFFKLNLKVYEDPDPEFEGFVKTIFLEIDVLNAYSVSSSKEGADVKKDAYVRFQIADCRSGEVLCYANLLGTALLSKLGFDFSKPSEEAIRIRNGFKIQFGGVEVMPSNRMEVGSGNIQMLMGKVQKGSMALLTYNGQPVGSPFLVEPGADYQLDLSDIILPGNKNIKASFRIDVFPYPAQFNIDGEVVGVTIILTEAKEEL